MSKFKIGDKVRVVDDGHMNKDVKNLVGHTAVVSAVLHGNLYRLKECSDPNMETWQWQESHLELANSVNNSLAKSMKSVLHKRKLQFWIERGYNVMFKGKHGVGKTATILETFEEAGLNYMYFSASTMDPWVDFIGVPKEKTDENGNTYLDLVRPKAFADDKVEAIFFDEYNRAPKKVRNAVMELIQFKSINGRKFKNLKVVWTAVNPPDDDELSYDVEELDPAQEDRFQVKVDIPYQPSYDFFRKKYGDSAEGAIAWWINLPENIKNEISPRRLDYALDMIQAGGDVNDVLPPGSNPRLLLTMIKNNGFDVQREVWSAARSCNSDKLKEIFSNVDNVSSFIEGKGFESSRKCKFNELVLEAFPDEKIIEVTLRLLKNYDATMKKYPSANNLYNLLRKYVFRPNSNSKWDNLADAAANYPEFKKIFDRRTKAKAKAATIGVANPRNWSYKYEKALAKFCNTGKKTSHECRMHLINIDKNWSSSSFWTAGRRKLIEAGVLVQTGQKRGAMYSTDAAAYKTYFGEDL